MISGPSGVGKTTITHAVRDALDALFSISLTSRPQTAADRDGVDYHFVTAQEFLDRRDRGELLEWADVFGHYYGTPRGPVDEAMNQGRLMILEIDVQGAMQVKANLPQAMAIFVLPPSEEVLLERLRRRQREDEATIQKRFAKARHEIARAKESGVYDHFVTNDQLDQTIARTIDLVKRELARRQRPSS